MTVGGREKGSRPPVAENIDMASVQKITLSPLRAIRLNKLVLGQANMCWVKAGDGRPGLRFHHQTAQSPADRAVAGIVTRSGYALRVTIPANPSHPGCRATCILIVARGYALPPSAYPQRSLMLIVARPRARFTRARSASLHST